MKLFRNAANGAATEKPNDEKVKPSPMPRKRGPGFLFSFQVFTLLVVAIVLISSTVAWYTNNRKTDNQFLRVQSDSAAEAIIGCYFIQSTWDPATETESFTNVSSVDAASFALNPYDAIFKTNYHTPAFIRIRMRAGSSTTMQTNIVVNITLTCTGASLVNPNATTAGAWNTVLSNVIKMSATTNGNLLGVEDATTLYTTLADETKTTWNTTCRLVSWTDADDLSTYSKQTTSPIIRLSLPASAIDSDGVAEVFVRIDYDDDLIDAFLESLGQSNEIRRLDDPVIVNLTADLDELHILTGS